MLFDLNFHLHISRDSIEFVVSFKTGYIFWLVQRFMNDSKYKGCEVEHSFALFGSLPVSIQTFCVGLFLIHTHILVYLCIAMYVSTNFR